MRKSKIFSSVVALVLAGGLALAAGIGSGWKYNVKEIGGWFNHWGAGEKTSTENKGDEANGGSGGAAEINGAILGDVESNGISFFSAVLPVEAYEENGIDAQADTAYLLSATITPSDATNQEVDWGVAWKNAESAWATGKSVSDYVVVRKSEATSLVATVECKMAFGEQIEITVTSQDNTNLSAKCAVDYCKRVESFSAETSVPGSTVAFGNFRLDDTPFIVTPRYGVGTVQGLYNYEKITLRLSDYVKSKMQYRSDIMIPFASGTYNGYYWKYTLRDFVTTSGTIRVNTTSFMTDVKTYTSSSVSSEITSGAAKTNTVEAARTRFNNDLVSAISAQHNPPVHLTGEISYSYTYAGRDFSSVYKISAIICVGLSLRTSVTGISVNDSLVL